MPEHHWRDIHANRPPERVSWHQPRPDLSLALIRRVAGPDASVVDVGSGGSTLVDHLLADGLRDVTLLDVADTAFDVVRRRLGAHREVRMIAADLTAWTPDRTWDVWHDRAVFHFLTEPADRAAYRAALTAALPPGGHAIVATFAPDGPERCSGLPVVRYSADALHEALGGQAFERLDAPRETHVTPAGGEQRFQYLLLRRR